MTPKEKADELIDKYVQFHPYYSRESNLKRAVGSSLIAVDEIINIVEKVYYHDANILVPYWERVREEINNIKINHK